MPLDNAETEELKALIAASRKRELNFGLCLAKKPEDTAFILHRMKEPDVLERRAKKIAKTAKTTHGKVSSKGRVISLLCAADPPAGLARKMKIFLKSLGLSMKVDICDANGTVLESDGEESDGDKTGAAADPDKARWEQVFNALSGRVEAALSSDAGDSSALRAAWSLAVETANEDDYLGALKIAARLQAKLPVPDAEGDAGKWAKAQEMAAPRVEAALKAGKGDVAKIRAVWDFAQGKAEAGDHAAALRSLKPLMGLVIAAGKATGPEAGQTVPEGTVEGARRGAGLLLELQQKADAMKAALVTLPDRAAELKSLVSDIRQGVQENDVDFAAVAMSKLDMLLRDAGREDERRAEVKAAFEKAFEDLSARRSEARKLDKKIRGVGALRKAAFEARKACAAKAEAGDFDAAAALVPAFEQAVATLEAAKAAQDEAKAAYLSRGYDKLQAAGRTAYGACEMQDPEQRRLVGVVDGLSRKLYPAEVAGDYVVALTEAADWAEAVAALEAATAKHARDKAKYEAERAGIADDLARVRAIQLPTTEMATLHAALLKRDAEATARATAHTFEPATGLLMQVAVQLDELGRLRARYDADKAAWEQGWKADGFGLTRIAEMGRLDTTLEPLKVAVIQSVTEAQAAVRANDFAGALKALAEARSRADAFERAKTQADAGRDDAFREARKAGADGFDARPHPAGGADAAALERVEAAVAGSKSLAKSKGLTALLAAFDGARKAHEKALAKPDASLIPAARTALGDAVTACVAYQGDHKADARSKDDREKFVQAEQLATSMRLMLAQLDDIEAIHVRMTGIDPAALAGNEAEALKQLGWLDAIAGSDAAAPLKQAARAKRAEVAGYLLRNAADKDRAAAMAGPEFKAAYDRQVAMGPLADTLTASTKRADHAATKVQNAASCEHVDQALRLAERLVNPAGGVDIAALFAFDLDTLPQETSAGRQMVKRLERLRDNPDALARLEAIEAPDQGSAAADMVRASLGLAAGDPVSAKEARQAVLAAFMSELRQKDVGSCFATQVAIDQQNTHPENFMRDMAELMKTGVLVREVGGERIETPIETRMSDAALEDRKLTLSRGVPPQLTGSASGGALDAPAGLEEAPAFKGAMGALGIDAGQQKGKMDAALTALMLAENRKAVERAVTKISDDATREAVKTQALAAVTADPASVKTALDAAMRNPGNGLSRVSTRRRGWVADEADAAQGEPFEPTPAEVVRELVMAECGVTDADLKAAERHRELEKEIKSDPRMSRVDDTGGLMQLDRAADKDLLDKMAELEKGNRDVPWIRIAEMDRKTQACYDAYTGGEDNRLLRAWEYTVTALCEKGAARTDMDAIKKADKEVLDDRLTEAFDQIAGSVKVNTKTLNKIADVLWDEYKRLWDEVVTTGYDASVRSELAADGSSSRGAHYLFDTAGIPDPQRWIKIDDQAKYQRLVGGLMMNAWANRYSGEKDKKVHAASRELAEQMVVEIGKESFATDAATAAKTATGKDYDLPWQRISGGFADDVIGIYEERPVTKEGLGRGKPAHAEDLMGRIGEHLKTLWTEPGTDLRDRALNDPENTGINATNAGVHTFSLTPGEPALRDMMEDPRGFDVCLAEFKQAEADKWRDLARDTEVPDRAACVKMVERAFGDLADDAHVDLVWNAAKRDAGADPVTARGVADYIKVLLERDYPGADADEFAGQALMSAIAPPVEPAKLQAKLERLCAAMKVPGDMVGPVTATAKTALDAKDPAKATVKDIRLEITKAMQAHNLDAAGVDHAAVVEAVREPQGLIFADSNWGDAEHRVKYAMVMNPMSGAMEMWQMNEDGSGASKMNQGQWVDTPWSTLR